MNTNEPTSAWERKPAITGRGHPCLCCGVIASQFLKEDRIAVGFGFAGLLRDEEIVWAEGSESEWENCMSGELAEQLAAADPDHDWRIAIEGPLSGRTYQRHGPGSWVLVEQNQGFA